MNSTPAHYGSPDGLPLPAAPSTQVFGALFSLGGAVAQASVKVVSDAVKVEATDKAANEETVKEPTVEEPEEQPEPEVTPAPKLVEKKAEKKAEKKTPAARKTVVAKKTPAARKAKKTTRGSKPPPRRKGLFGGSR